MKHLLVAAIFGLAACSGDDADGGQDRTVEGSKTSGPSAAAASDITDDEVRRGCTSFTQAVANEDNNEVYDAQTGVLQVYVGQQRFALSRQCRSAETTLWRWSG